MGCLQLRIIGVVALQWLNRRHPIPPYFLNGCQNAQFVIDEDITLGRVACFDVFRLSFLMDVNQHIAVNRFEQSGSFDLARLKHNVSVGQNDRLAQLLDALDDIERIG